MGHVAELGPDENRAPENREPGGGDLERTGAAGEPAPLDPEQLRQFQQFQQFQDYLRFTEAQRQAGGELVPDQPQQPVTQQNWLPTQGAPPGGPPTVPPPPALPAPVPKARAPRWLKRFGGKMLSALLLLVVLSLAGRFAYNYFFPEDDENLPASMTGGGTYHTNQILSTEPYEAVRKVYDAIAQNKSGKKDMTGFACGRFREDIQQRFALDVQAIDCRDAVRKLTDQVVNPPAYAESMPSSRVEPPPGNTLRIDSCDFKIEGGPALGAFTVSRVENNQWLITGHEPGPAKCPQSSPSPTR
ncbi:hypothetical protein [Amycolatopsis nigrescens]|uniref:hypothetical protein n=1 Tax=Amycolatopsis nigrescens TaxID=381445 RepID=UPI003CCC0F23